MTARTCTRRRAFTLIELVLVVGGVTVVLGLCAGLLHALLKLDRSGRQTLADSGNVARLARQFREDVRASSTAKAAAAGLDLATGDGPAIAYRVEGTGLIREETLGGAVRSREGYMIDRLGPLGFEVKGSRVRLLLARRSGTGLALARPAVNIDASLGKDRALADLKGAKR